MSMVNTTHPRQVAKQNLINGVAKMMVSDTRLKRSGFFWPHMIPLSADESESEDDLLVLAVETVKQSVVWKPALSRWTANIGGHEYFSQYC